jgi:hypothetical protein
LADGKGFVKDGVEYRCRRSDSALLLASQCSVSAINRCLPAVLRARWYWQK